MVSKDEMRQMVCPEDFEEDEDDTPVRGGSPALDSAMLEQLLRLEQRMDAWFLRLEALLARPQQGPVPRSCSSLSARLAEPSEAAQSSASVPLPAGARARDVGGEVFNALPTMQGHFVMKGLHARPWRQELPPCVESPKHDNTTPFGRQPSQPYVPLHMEMRAAIVRGMSMMSRQFTDGFLQQPRLKYALLDVFVACIIMLDLALVGVEVQQEAAGLATAVSKFLCKATLCLALLFVLEVAARILLLCRDGWPRPRQTSWERPPRSEYYGLAASTVCAMASCAAAHVCLHGDRWSSAGAATVAAARAMRLARLLLLVHTLPLLAGLRRVALVGFGALRTLLWTLLLIALLTYVASVILTEGASEFIRSHGGEAPGVDTVVSREMGSFWRTVGMLTHGLASSARWDEAIELVAHFGLWYQCVLAVHVLVSWFALAGLVYGVVFAWGAQLVRNDSAAFGLQLDRERDMELSHRLQVLLEAQAQGPTISYIEFSRAWQEEEGERILAEMMADAQQAHRLFGLLQGSQRSNPKISELVEGLKRLQAYREARSADVHLLGLQVKRLVEMAAATPPAIATPKFGVSRSSLASGSFCSAV